MNHDLTPISTDWRITLMAIPVSFFPSIGNWSYPCRSHYWIKNGLVLWAEDWSDEEMRTSRAVAGDESRNITHGSKT
jgi:hypothetical protein